MTYFNAQGQGRVGWRSLVVTQVVNAVDADAQAFITAAGITNLTQASAINTLVNDLKTYGLWTKMKALYPMVGGTATSHKFNLKDPRDLDAAFRLVFNGGWVHTSTGALPNGTNGYANTYLHTKNVLTPNNLSIGLYTNTNRAADTSPSKIAYGNADNNTTYVPITQFYLRTNSNQLLVDLGDYNYGRVSGTNTATAGFYVNTRTTNNSMKVFKNNTLFGSSTTTNPTNTLPNSYLYFAAFNENGSYASSFEIINFQFSYVSDGLSDTEAANFYTSVQKFQTTLGRQIGSPIVSDTDAQAFINAAGLTDLGQANAVNTLVVDLKAAGVWTKMKALYPFVGGTATSHKWNLKDPRDLDAAFRLVFNGGWTHTSTGALGNGTTAYADTKFLPSSAYSLATFDVGVSFYKDKNVSNNNGSYDSTNRFLYGEYSNSIEGRLNSDSWAPFVVNYSSNGTGFFSTNRVRNNILFAYHNGNNVGNIIKNDGLSTFNSYIGARNGSGIANIFDTIEQRFVAYHVGLTDSENSAFYTAVQKYQTSLGRQIGTPVLAEGQTAGLLETYSGAAAAYSLRKLRTGYVGNAIRVRRSSDNTEQDIAFNNSGGLDTTSLLAFVGSGNGFVTTWYDQSGNISNLIQTTAANQARIVYNGVLETLNGKPALVTKYNYSTSGFYKATYSSTINGPATVFNIGSNVATAGVSYLWDGLNTNMYAYSYNNTWMRIGGSAEFALTGYTQGITTQRIINAIYNGASSKLRINNGTYATGNTGTIAATGLTLGGAYNGTYLAPAYNQEHIVYPSNQETNATNINTNINSYYTIY
jgi:hypothetical protein